MAHLLDQLDPNERAPCERCGMPEGLPSLASTPILHFLGDQGEDAPPVFSKVFVCQFCRAMSDHGQWVLQRKPKK